MTKNRAVSNSTSQGCTLRSGIGTGSVFCHSFLVSDNLFDLLLVILVFPPKRSQKWHFSSLSWKKPRNKVVAILLLKEEKCRFWDLFEGKQGWHIKDQMLRKLMLYHKKISVLHTSSMNVTFHKGLTKRSLYQICVQTYDTPRDNTPVIVLVL